MKYTDFAKQIKAKYPQYASVDDKQLAEKIIAKHPAYKDQVEFDTGFTSAVGNTLKSIGSAIMGDRGLGVLGNTKFFQEAAEGLTTGEEKAAAQRRMAESLYNEEKPAPRDVVESKKDTFGTHTAKFLFDSSKSFFDTITNKLSETTMFREVAEGLNVVESGEAQGETLDFLAQELTGNLTEASKSFSGRGTANIIDTMIASPLNFATRSIYGKSNAMGDFFADFSEQMRETFSTERSRAASAQEFGLDKMGNPDFWLTTVAENTPVTLAFMKAAAIPYAATSNAVSALLGSSTFAKVAAGVAGAVTGGTTMRAFESSAEAEETYKNAKHNGMGEKEAIAAGRQVFEDNMKLLGLDAVQVALALSPLKLGSGSIMSKILMETAALAVGGATEGGEEVFQYGAQQRALGLTDLSSLELALSDPKAQESGFIGAVMGVIFQAGGRINQFGEEKIREKYLDQVALNLGVEWTDAYSKLKTVTEKQAFLDKVAAADERGVQDAVRAVEEENQRSATATKEVFETVRNTPTEETVRAELSSGKSPNQVALELSSKIGTEDAIALVTDVVSRETATPAPKPVVAKKTTLADTKKALSDVDDKVLEKTPADLQEEFTALTEEMETGTKDIVSEIERLKESIAGAKDGTQTKKELKKELADQQAQLKMAEKNFSADMSKKAESFRTFLGGYIKQNFADLGLTDEQQSDLIDDIAIQITDPTALKTSFASSIKDIVAKQVDTVKSGANKPVSAEKSSKTPLKDKKEPQLKKSNYTEKAWKYVQEWGAVEFDDKAEAVKYAASLEQTDGGTWVAEESRKGIWRAHRIDLAKKTQKEKVKDAIQKKGKASIKEVADETGILEPNIRRILGVGAKEGDFERVADGVYTIKVGDQDVAFVIPADALLTLPKLAKQGFKADMVFLDIPYNTPAVKGGNRGVKYNLISVDNFDKLLDSVKTILRTKDSPVIHMYSQAASGLKAMQKYNDLFPTKGFTPIGRGEYTKLQLDGVTRVRNMRGNIIEPEGILVFNQSGMSDKIGNLNFKLVRPKGYQTEKPAEMLKALIEMTTEEGDVVLDPFAGSGVTAAEAVRSKRKVVAIEKDEKVAKEVTVPRVEAAAKEVKQIGLMDSDESYTPRMNALIKEAQENNDPFPYLKMTKEEQAIVDKAFTEILRATPITVPEGFKPYVRTITGETVDTARLNDPAYFVEAYESTFARGGTDEKLYKTLTKELVPKGREASGFLADMYRKAKGSQKKTVKVPKESDKNTLSIITDKTLSPTEKVDKILDIKQEGKDYKDIGERVVGSRKERAAIRAVIQHGDTALTAELLARLGVDTITGVYDKSDTLAETEKPNPEEDRKSGVPAIVGWAKKKIYDAIPKTLALSYSQNNYSSYPVAYRFEKNEHGDDQKRSITNFVGDQKYVAAIFENYQALLQEFVQKLTAIKTLEELGSFWSEYKSGFPKEIQVGDETIYLTETLFGLRVQKFEIPFAFGRRDPQRFVERYKEKMASETTTEEAKAEWNTLINAPSWYDSLVRTPTERVETELRHGNFAPLDHITRSAGTVPDSRATVEVLTTELGFSSVQFGNYMDDQTSREHIRHTIGAVLDMSKVLNVDFPTLINEQGLSLAYGARGGGGFAVAHYEPKANIINTTKKKGDGSFFHEFTHFLDFTTNRDGYRKRLSSTKTRWYRSNELDSLSAKLMSQINGKGIQRKVKFIQTDGKMVLESNQVFKDFEKGKTLEDAVTEALKEESVHKKFDTLQTIANVYGKTIELKEPLTAYDRATYYAKLSGTYGGAYWTRPEELLARAAQAYIEDKLKAAGMENNYLTRSTLALFDFDSYARVYPQGEEREAINKAFDDMFAVFSKEYPYTDSKVRFKTSGDTETTYTPTDAARYLTDLKERLNLDFDVHFVDTILADRKVNPLTKAVVGRVEAYGATADNTIALINDMAAYTAEHETVHLTLANLQKIPAFRDQGLTRDKILEAKAQQMGIEYTERSADSIEEQLAMDFEQFVQNKYNPQGVIRKFFLLLKAALEKFARAIGMTNGDIITNYFEILIEGRAVDREMVRLENKGIMAAYIEDGVFDTDQIEVLLSNRVKPMEETRANEIADRMEAVAETSLRAEVLNELSDADMRALAISDAGKRIWDMLEDEFAFMLDSAMRGMREDFRFKVKEEGDDARLQKIHKQYNELANQSEKLENDTTAWKTDLDQELLRREETAVVVAETPDSVRKLSRFTTKNPPKGTLTERGISEVETTDFANPQEAQAEVTAYLKRKAELVQTRNKLRQLRRDIAAAKREGRTTKAALRDVERRLKLRKRFLEQKDYYVNMGFGRGRKDNMRMIRHRGRAVRDAQDFFMISDNKAKEIISNRRIHLMSEEEFNDFLVEFSNKAQLLRGMLDARDEVRAFLQERQFGKTDNLRLAMKLPPVDKMNETEAHRFLSVLAKYQFGDVFLTKRELETVHRTQWGEMKTERELLAKLKEHTGTGREELATLTAPQNGGYYTPWIRLARSHPFFNWLVGKRVEAAIKAERDYVAIEEEVNALVRAARSSRRKLMSAGERAVDMLIPTDDVVFGFMEAEKKEEYAKAHSMTDEEMKLADYLTWLYFAAYEYMKSEYGMKGRKDYMTHVRRSFFEAMKESGVMSAFREIITSQKEEEAAFKILDEETGEVLAFEKFFGFAMHRSGALVPSKNVARASLSYFQAFSKKMAMDEFIPEAMLAVQAHKAIKGTTEKGLPKDPTLEKFVKRFINDAKGRKVWFLTKQGSTSDIALRAMTTWITIKYLGANLATAVSNFVGDFTAIAWELSLKETAVGIARTVAHPIQSHEVNKQFRFFTGRNPLVELFDPKYNLPSRTLKALMVLMSLAAFQSNKFFLRAKMTDEEFAAALVEDTRLKEIALSLSRVKPNAFYVKSLAGNTTAGGANFQFGTWAVAIFNTVISDAGEVVGMLKDKKGWETLKSKEAQKLTKFAIMAGLALAVTALVEPPDDDDDSLYAQIFRKAQRELTTLTQALQFVANPANYALMIKEISQWYMLLEQLLTQEKYKTDGTGYSMGDPKWLRTGTRLVVPSSLKQFFPDQEEHSKDRLIGEAVSAGELNAEEIVEFLYGDTLKEKEDEGEEAFKEYKDKKLGEITALYNFRRKYPVSPIGNIILEENKNDTRVERMIEYAKEVGVDVAYDELKTLYKDKELCANTKDKTGCMVSGQLFKDFQRARRDIIK